MAHAGREGNGVHENLWDTLHMLATSQNVLLLFLSQVGGLLFYNIAGMTVTGHLGAVFRSILETVRTLFVWLVGLAMFYGHTGLGEAWDAFSWLQGLGFAVLVAGTVVYGRGDELAASAVRAATCGVMRMCWSTVWTVCCVSACQHAGLPCSGILAQVPKTCPAHPMMQVTTEPR